MKDNLIAIIKESYLEKTGGHAIITHKDDKLHYLMLDMWAPTIEHKTQLLRILHELIALYPEYTGTMVDRLIDKIPVTSDSTYEVCWLVGFLSASSIFAGEDNPGDLLLEIYSNDGDK